MEGETRSAASLHNFSLKLKKSACDGIESVKPGLLPLIVGSQLPETLESVVDHGDRGIARRKSRGIASYYVQARDLISLGGSHQRLVEQCKHLTGMIDQSYRFFGVSGGAILHPSDRY